MNHGLLIIRSVLERRTDGWMDGWMAKANNNKFVVWNELNCRVLHEPMAA